MRVSGSSRDPGKAPVGTAGPEKDGGDEGGRKEQGRSGPDTSLSVKPAETLT